MNLRRRARNAVLCLLAAALASTAALAGEAAFQGVEIRVEARKPVGGVRTVRVAQDGTIELRVRADEALELHVHGYDVHLAVEKDAPARLSIAAHLVGRFPVTAHLREAHQREPVLLYLEVHPR